MIGITIESSSFATTTGSSNNNNSSTLSSSSSISNSSSSSSLARQSLTKGSGSTNNLLVLNNSNSFSSLNNNNNNIHNNNGSTQSTPRGSSGGGTKYVATTGSKKGQLSSTSFNSSKIVETSKRSISEEVTSSNRVTPTAPLDDATIKLRKELDHMKLLLNCQKEENLILSTSLFSTQEEVKKLKTIIKKRDGEIREQQEKMETLLSHGGGGGADMRPSRQSTSRTSPNNNSSISSSTDSLVLKKEVELLRAKLKASEEKYEKLKLINNETEDNVECLLNQLENSRITKDQLLNQAKNSLLHTENEREKNDSFRAYLERYQESNQHLGENELEDKYEKLLLAKQDLESKLFKREEQLIEMTMKFESARSELVKNSITM